MPWTNPLEHIGWEPETLSSRVIEEASSVAEGAWYDAEVGGEITGAGFAVLCELPLWAAAMLIIGLCVGCLVALREILPDQSLFGISLRTPVDFVLNPVRGVADGIRRRFLQSFSGAYNHLRSVVFSMVPGLDWRHMPAWFSWATHTMSTMWNSIYHAHQRITIIQGPTNKTIAGLEQDVWELQHQIDVIHSGIAAFNNLAPTLEREINHWNRVLSRHDAEIIAQGKAITSIDKWIKAQDKWDTWAEHQLHNVHKWESDTTNTVNKDLRAINHNFSKLWPLLALMPIAKASPTAIRTLVKVGYNPCHCFSIPGSTGELTLALAIYDWWLAE